MSKRNVQCIDTRTLRMAERKKMWEYAEEMRHIWKTIEDQTASVRSFARETVAFGLCIHSTMSDQPAIRTVRLQKNGCVLMHENRSSTHTHTHTLCTRRIHFFRALFFSPCISLFLRWPKRMLMDFIHRKYQCGSDIKLTFSHSFSVI